MLPHPGYRPVHVGGTQDSIGSSNTLLSSPSSRRVRISETLTYHGNGSEISTRPLIKSPQPTSRLASLRPPGHRWITLALTLLAMTPFIGLVVGTILLHNRPIENSTWNGIKLAVNVIVTLFPIVFAAITGQFVRRLAQLRLQRGVPFLYLEQLVGSVTFFGTISTQWTLGVFNILGVAMGLLWLLSPLGAQSALRVISAEYQPLVSTVDLAYLDINAYNQSTDTSVWTQANIAADKLWLASLVAGNASAPSASDIWGNFKVPVWNSLPQANASGWRELSQNNNTPVYSSLVGVPILNLGVGNTTLTVETSYLDMDCFNLRNSSWVSAFFPYQYLYYQDSRNTTMLPNSSEPSTFFFATYNYGGDAYSGITTADCLVRERFVQAAVTCITTAATGQPRCTVTAIHLSEKADQKVSSNAPILFSNPAMFRAFTDSLANAAPMAHPGSRILTTNYLIDPSNPFNDDPNSQQYVFNLAEDVFSQRLMDIVNSFYIARLGFEVLTVGGDGSGLNTSSTNLQHTVGVNTQMSTTLICTTDWRWFAVLLVATLAMFATSLATVWVGSQTLIPDILGYVSTLTRDNPFLDLPGVSGTLNGLQRTRLLGDLFIRLGDARADDEGVGQLAVGSMATTARSDGRRYYG